MMGSDEQAFFPLEPRNEECRLGESDKFVFLSFADLVSGSEESALTVHVVGVAPNFCL
jgi:hypothetical protein